MNFEGEIQKLALEPDDIIVLRSERPMSRDAVERLRDTIRSYLFLNNKVIILDRGMTLEKVKPDTDKEGFNGNSDGLGARTP